jgi:hypothetical protein
MKLSNQQVSGNPGCDSGTGQPPSSQCVKVTYSAGFRPGIFVVLAVSFNKDSGVISSQNLLAGAQYTTIDANGFATTALFGNAVPPNSPNGVFTADSGNPDLTTPNVLLTASTFQNASAVKFSSPPFNNRKLAQCTQPFITVGNGKKAQTVCPDGNLPAGPD